MKRNIIVFSPHADDESIGCGGTIMRLAEAGEEVTWVLFTDPKEEFGYTKRFVDERQKQHKFVIRELGIKNLINFAYEPSSLGDIPMASLVAQVRQVLKNIEPYKVFLPFRHDAHSDHKVVFDCALAACKPFRNRSIQEINIYETISETEFNFDPNAHAFRPNSFVDISAYLDKKLSVVSIYKNELSAHPFPRSIDNLKALALHRGATAGVRYAESFIKVFELIQ